MPVPLLGVLIRKCDKQVPACSRVEIRAALIVDHDLGLVLAVIDLNCRRPTQHNKERLQRRRAGVQGVIFPSIELPSDES